MPSITFIHPTGRAEVVDAAAGVSVMRAAIVNGVDGIIGECGGQAMCATCHVYVESELALHAPSEDEEEMLECTADERLDNSRLGCQLRAGTDFESLTVRLPSTQI